MHYGKAEFPLGQVFAETLVVGVLGRLEVHVIVPDLKVDRDEVDERDVVAGISGCSMGCHSMQRKLSVSPLKWGILSNFGRLEQPDRRTRRECDHQKSRQP